MKILALLLVGLAAVSAISRSEAQLSVEGVLNGTEATKKYGDVISCIMDVDQIIDSFSKCIDRFSNGSYDGVKDGIWYLGDTLKAVANAMGDCKSFDGDASRLQAMATTFMNPDSVVYT